ncbi:MAG: cysteine desulfurase NifS [Methylocystaceae bacterium]
MNSAYFDHSATTPVDPSVAAIMHTMLTTNFGNPSSVHQWGRAAREAIDKARQQVASLIGASPQEIIFTSGGTEADNLAIVGAVMALSKPGKHLITSAIEHHAVLDTMHYLTTQGYELTILPVNSYGQVDLSELAAAVRDDTVMISIMQANNEVGTIQPLAEIGKLAKEKGILLHTDAVQSSGRIPINVSELGVDLLTLSAHKFYGPKGAGALYLRKGIRLSPLVHGGGQERKWRSGTENVPGIVGLGQAAEIAVAQMSERTSHLQELAAYLIQGVLAQIPDASLTGHPEQRLPGHTSFIFKGVEGESMLIMLDLQGIAASSGSACTSGSLDPSHVLIALGLPHEVAHGSLRLTLGKDNTREEVDHLLSVLPGIISRLREMSPIYKKGV